MHLPGANFRKGMTDSDPRRNLRRSMTEHATMANQHEPRYIHFKERAKIRDLFIPLEISGEGPVELKEAVFDDAYCYVGDTEPRMLFDGKDPELTAWLMEIFLKSEQRPKTARNWRIEHEGIMFRARIGQTVQGPELILRTLPPSTPSLEDLKMPGFWRELLRDHALLYGGLVLISSKNGQGKTTLASATVKSRLERFGGHANTLEDPPELPLHGAHGKGRCRQVQADVHSEGPGSFADGLINMRREFPAMTGGGTMMFIGEIRDAKTAEETLLAAFEGHLVIATFHSATIQHAVTRLTQMAGSTGGTDQARELLSQVLRVCLSPNLHLSDGEGWDRGTFRGSSLLVPNPDHGIAKAIRDGNLDTLTGLIGEQQTVFNGLPANATMADINKALKR